MKITINHTIHDGNERHIGKGKYRPQIEFHCDVLCEVEPGDPGVCRDKNGEGYPATAASVDVQRVTVTGCTIYARPDFDFGVEIDSRDEFYAEFLAAHATWCKERIDIEHNQEWKTGIYDSDGVYSKAVEAAGREWCDREAG